MLSMLIAREVVHSSLEVARQKMSELLTQPAALATESLDETPEPDSSAKSTAGIIASKLLLLAMQRSQFISCI